jgi:hypothetical protein
MVAASVGGALRRQPTTFSWHCFFFVAKHELNLGYHNAVFDHCYLSEKDRMIVFSVTHSSEMVNTSGVMTGNLLFL